MDKGWANPRWKYPPNGILYEVYDLANTFICDCYESMLIWCAGDIVQVTQGPHSGQQGKILTVLRRKQRVVIDGVNMVRVHHYSVVVKCGD
jgi:hypothetical protein